MGRPRPASAPACACGCGCGQSPRQAGSIYVRGHQPYTEEMRRKDRVKKLGKKHSKATRAKISAVQVGKTLSEAHKSKIRLNSWRGRSGHTEAAKAKIRDALLKRPPRSPRLFDTKPERQLESWLKANTVRHRKQVRLPGIPALFDFVILELRVLIEVNGCYWHGCRKCGHEDANKDNQERDKVKARLARRSGWTLIVVWEHELKDGSFAARLNRRMELWNRASL